MGPRKAESRAACFVEPVRKERDAIRLLNLVPALSVLRANACVGFGDFSACHPRATVCSVSAQPARLTHGSKPNPLSQARLKGPYGIRTRAAAVRGRCPRPLDEWAVADAKGTESRS